MLDQIEAATQTERAELLTALTFAKSPSITRPSAFAIALLPRASDAAALLHVGFSAAELPFDDASRREIAKQLCRKLDSQYRDCGVRFVRWATDTWDDETNWWADQLAMEPLGELRYLTKSLRRPTTDFPPTSVALSGNIEPADAAGLSLCPVDWSDPQMTDAFARMLDQTYQDSLDFPALAKFCTADQIMSDYRRAESFCPDSWFWVSVNQPAAPQVDRPANRQDSHQQHRSRVGCVVLGYHRTADVDRHGADTAASTAELVYMGLVPAARGGGLGHALLRSAIEQAEWSGADRLILAVDRKNVPAQRVYAAAGMQSELQEHWWGKLIIARANDEVSGQEA